MGEEILAVEPTPTTTATPVLREVFAASYQRLVMQLYGVIGDFGDAEDVVQEAFVRAAAAGRRFTAVDNHEAWLRRTAINLQRKRWRKLRNFSRIQHRLENPVEAPGIGQHLEVIEALRTLPEPQRQVLALFYLADLPVDEIARTLGCATGTVKSRLARGRTALEIPLGHDDPPADDEESHHA